MNGEDTWPRLFLNFGLTFLRYEGITVLSSQLYVPKYPDTLLECYPGLVLSARLNGIDDICNYKARVAATNTKIPFNPTLVF